MYSADRKIRYYSASLGRRTFRPRLAGPLWARRIGMTAAFRGTCRNPVPRRPDQRTCAPGRDTSGSAPAAAASARSSDLLRRVGGSAAHALRLTDPNRASPPVRNALRAGDRLFARIRNHGSRPVGGSCCRARYGRCSRSTSPGARTNTKCAFDVWPTAKAVARGRRF